MALDVSGVPQVRKSRAQSRLLAWKKFCFWGGFFFGKDVFHLTQIFLFHYKQLSVGFSERHRLLFEVLVGVGGDGVELSACKRCSRELFSLVNALESCLPGPSKGPWTAEGNTPHASPGNVPSISSFGFCTGVGLCRPQLIMNLRSKNSPLGEARTHLGEVIHFPVNGSKLMFCCYSHIFALIGEMSQNCKFHVLFLLQFMHLHILRYMDVDIDFSLKLESLSWCLPSVHGADAAYGIWEKCYNEICTLTRHFAVS